MSVGEAYLRVVHSLMDEMAQTELPNIAALADRMASVIAEGGAVTVYDNGHMLNHELFNRAGGLACLQSLSVTPPEVAHAVRRGDASAAGPADGAVDGFALAWAGEVVKRADLRPHDVLIIGSVSGRSPFIVELAIRARAAGVWVVALTAVRYARILPALHPSGHLLYEVCDEVLDLGSEPGDAALSLDGVDEKVGPTSGVMAAILCWCLTAELAVRLVKRGLAPTVFRSINYPDGPEKYHAQVERYQRLGY